MKLPFATTYLLILLTCSLASPQYAQSSDYNFSSPPSSLVERGAGVSNQGNILRPWPVNDPVASRKLTVIEFCFALLPFREQALFRFMMAIDIWINALGGEAGPHSGHSIAFQETFYSDGTPLPCYIPGTAQNHPPYGQWNPVLPSHILQIMPVSDRDSAVASVGYRVGVNLENGRHSMAFAPDFDVERIYMLVHELGHVFGMMHEHQRSDRDDFVQINWPAISGYETGLQAAMTEGFSKEEAEYRLQTEEAFGKYFNVPTGDFNKAVNGILGPPDDPYTIDESSPYDIDSLMNYASAHYSLAPDSGDAKDATILKWVKDESGNKIGSVPYPHNTAPSVGDVAWIRKWYPWRGA
ncbi:hypothetical protein P280DRAFT_554799 [Massarina eburnea CBS 473.64]|uniref:Metalloendopeptidase n=1 Tax=Massarina eburnea CBS 473.64 TaxID=1395130 RepID=A0A6A6RGG4_9PLEO|nr:hypothetical protein P280DRAFT_554799 [Massarina eburnea CBS 473.64]